MATARLARSMCAAYSSGASAVVGRAGKMREPDGPFGVQRVALMDTPRARQGDLLLEQRRDHHGGAAAVLEPLDRIEIKAKGRRSSDERVRQSKSEKGGGRVHIPDLLTPWCYAWVVPSNGKVRGGSGSAEHAWGPSMTRSRPGRGDFRQRQAFRAFNRGARRFSGRRAFFARQNAIASRKPAKNRSVCSRHCANGRAQIRSGWISPVGRENFPSALQPTATFSSPERAAACAHSRNRSAQTLRG